MLPRAQRIGAQLFSEGMQRGKSFHAPHLSVRVFSVSPTSPSRFAVSVSKKLDKRAVYRNRIKRVVMNAVQNERTSPSYRENNLCYIFFPKKGVLDIPRGQLQEEIRALIQKKQ